MNTDTTTTRRRLLMAAPALAVAAAVPAAVIAQEPAGPESDRYTREEYDAGRKTAEDIAYLHMARAWVDRWKALGGSFNLSFDRNLQPTAAHRSILVDLDLWTPTDEGREDIRPHTWLTEQTHHDGAVKALEGLLELCPGLQDALREIAGSEAFGRWAARQVA